VNKKYFSPIAYWRKLKLVTVATILRLGIPVKTKVSVGGHQINFVTTSYLEYFLRAREGYEREPLTVRWILDVIRPDDIVFDVGANVGTYSLLMGKIVEFGKGKVFAFEPEASNFYSLNRNILSNHLSDSVLTFLLACGDKCRASKIYLSSFVPGAALHGIDKPESEGHRFSEQHVQGVFIYSLDELVFDLNLPAPNHIKVDVDGAERMIVENMPRLLRDARLQSVMIEINSELSCGIVESKLLQAGFHEIQREPSGASAYNVLFSRSLTKSASGWPK